MQGAWVSVDGTDFRIQEPIPFDPMWYSHKFKTAGVRYEVGVAVHTGDIVWVNGAFACGPWSDLKIFRADMKHALDPHEKVIADRGYIDESCNYPPGGEHSRLFSLVRARHETVNKRFKQFGVLSSRFRHHRRLHSFCFHAIANLTQLMMDTEPLFYLHIN